MSKKKNKESLEWHTEQRRVGDLELWGKNPRVLPEDEREQLNESLDKFNLVEIPAINLDDMVCAGHQRIKLLVAAGREDDMIDCRVPNRMLTRDEFEEYNARSNRNRGEFDYDALKQIMSTERLLSMGFTEGELGLNAADDDVEDLDDLSEELELERYVQVRCASEQEQQEVYNEMKDKGYECEILTL